MGDLMMALLARFARTGPSDWIIQRVTAVVMMAYLFFIVGYLIANPALTYGQWSDLNSLLSMRIFTLFTMHGLGCGVF